MIAVSSSAGSLLKVIPETTGEIYGLHPLYGLIRENSLKGRDRMRSKRGLSTGGAWLCRFSVARVGSSVALMPVENCEIVKKGPAAWEIQTPGANLLVSDSLSLDPNRVAEKEQDNDRGFQIALAAALSLFLLFMLLPKGEAPKQDELRIIEQVTVQLQPEKQEAVKIPQDVLPNLPKELAQNEKVKRAIKQDLGFLGMIGKKDLKKALGGMPTNMKDVTAGAGPGGKEGSGGEVLMGLGEGLKRVTVGNSGMKGLGGIGTKGAGGGAGGYGNAMVGSGEGKALSAMPLSGEMVLEGGLAKPAIQATIAKYLSQVRACYERGLKSAPGITGTVTMGFEIGAAGQVNTASVKKTTLGNPEVEGCVSRAMLGWQFPKPVGGVNVKVSYPFLLRPMDG